MLSGTFGQQQLGVDAVDERIVWVPVMRHLVETGEFARRRGAALR
jgi:hypothetical protein